METAELEISGLVELQEDFEKLIKKYPDKAEELLKKDAKELRKDVVKNVKKLTKYDTENKRSLAKAGSYKISGVQGFGAYQSIDISAKSPHFHLVEHGHNLIINGKNRGFVQGKHMMEQAIAKHQNEMPKNVEKMIDKLLKEGGF